MKNTALLTALALLCASPLLAADAGKPDANQILRQMSAKIGGTRQFSFTARRELDASLTEEGVLPQSANIKVSVLRPDKVMASSASKNDVRRIIADGQRLTLLDEKKNLYATVPMRTSIDGLVVRLDELYGFTPPLADFVVSDPYKGIMQQAHTASYLGRATYHTGFLGIAGVECHRIALAGKIADAELWVGVADQLPRKLTATFKDRPGNPQLKIEFSDWNPAAKVTAQDFVFVPPKGAQKITMRTTAEMQKKP